MFQTTNQITIIPIVGLYPMKTTIHITINHYGNHKSILIVVNCDINKSLYSIYLLCGIITTINILGGSSHLVSRVNK